MLADMLVLVPLHYEYKTPSMILIFMLQIAL